MEVWCDVVNKLFEEGQTTVWPAGSLEEQVQNLVKTWETELFHNTYRKVHKTIDAAKLQIFVNGRHPSTPEGVAEKGGGYNMFLQTSLPKKLRLYNPSEETVDTAHELFSTTFERGFAMEILQVYSGPPVIAYKFRHWGYMDGPFKGHSPTRELVEMFGMCAMELDDNFKVVKMDLFYDRGELRAGLMKGVGATTATGGGLQHVHFLKGWNTDSFASQMNMILSKWNK